MRKIIGLTRYAVVIPSITSIIGALLLMAQGSIEIVLIVRDAVLLDTYLKYTIVDVMTAVDAILLGTVLLVIGYGLYELFVDTRLEVPTWLQVRSLDDLKSKLICVVVAIIAVVFVGVLVDTNRAADVVSYGVGAGALVAGLALFALATRKDESPKKPAGKTTYPSWLIACLQRPAHSRNTGKFSILVINSLDFWDYCLSTFLERLG